MTGQDTDFGPASHGCISQRLRLNYLDWGNPGAPTLILLHGMRDHARSWDWTARALRDDWHVVAPDLRGHGDSAWSADGAYLMPHLVYDLAQIVEQLGRDRVTIVGHSLGGAVAVRYAGLYPARVARLVAIEGLGLSPAQRAAQAEAPVADRWIAWIDERRRLSGRARRRYATIEDAMARMCAANAHLTAEQARHLTVHGILRNEDGSYGWKYDDHVRAQPPFGVTDAEQYALWARIACPTLLAYGSESWASNPQQDGRAAHFRDARVVVFEAAGHWPHHDRFDAFIAELRAFLGAAEA